MKTATILLVIIAALVFFVPLKWSLPIGALLWFKGHHLIDFFLGKGSRLDALLKTFAIRRR